MEEKVKRHIHLLTQIWLVCSFKFVCVAFVGKLTVQTAWGTRTNIKHCNENESNNVRIHGRWWQISEGKFINKNIFESVWKQCFAFGCLNRIRKAIFISFSKIHFIFDIFSESTTAFQLCKCMDAIESLSLR